MYLSLSLRHDNVLYLVVFFQTEPKFVRKFLARHRYNVTRNHCHHWNYETSYDLSLSDVIRLVVCVSLWYMFLYSSLTPGQPVSRSRNQTIRLLVILRPWAAQTLRWSLSVALWGVWRVFFLVLPRMRVNENCRYLVHYWWLQSTSFVFRFIFVFGRATLHFGGAWLCDKISVMRIKIMTFPWWTQLPVKRKKICKGWYETGYRQTAMSKSIPLDQYDGINQIWSKLVIYSLFSSPTHRLPRLQAVREDFYRPGDWYRQIVKTMTLQEARRAVCRVFSRWTAGKWYRRMFSKS